MKLDANLQELFAGETAARARKRLEKMQQVMATAEEPPANGVVLMVVEDIVREDDEEADDEVDVAEIAADANEAAGKSQLSSCYGSPPLLAPACFPCPPCSYAEDWAGA
jgi:hypothetical protein